MAYIWSKDLETGNEMIDSQHKELIDAINNMLKACMKLEGLDKLTETAEFLQNYIIRHFSQEENLQLATNYPDYQNHKLLHANFNNIVKNLVSELRAKGATPKLLKDITSLVGEWFINHIKTDDKKVAEHVRNYGS